MVFPQPLPVNNLPKEYVISYEVGRNFKRFIAADGGGVTRSTLIYRVPAGKKAIVSEIYSVLYQFTTDPSGIKFVKENGTSIFARIAVTTSGSAVYGSVNYINNYPITLIEGEAIYLEITGADGAQYLLMSVFLEEKEKNS